MADATVLYANSLTDVTTTSTVTYSDCAKITAASFASSTRYILIGGGYFNHSAAAALTDIRLAYGTTPTVPTDAGFSQVNPGGSANSIMYYGWVRDYTSPGTTEDVAIQCKANGAGTVTCYASWLMALKVTSDFTDGTDFSFNEATADITTTTSYQDGASVTVSANGTDKWLVVAEGARTAAVTNSNCFQNITDGTTNYEVQMEGTDASATGCYLSMHAFTPSAGSTTFKVQFKHELTAETIKSSRIFAINLSKFSQVSTSYTAASTALSTNPTFTTVETLSPTPTATGNWVILAYAAKTQSTNGRDVTVRMQINPSGGGLADDPNAGSYSIDNSADATDVVPLQIINVRSLTSGAARTINFDAWQDAASAAVQQTGLVAFSVAMAAASPSGGLAWITA